MAEAFVGILGVLVGFLLSRYGDYRKEKKQSQQIRSFLKIQIEKNLKQLESYWDRVKQIMKRDNGLGESELFFEIASLGGRNYEEVKEFPGFFLRALEAQYPLLAISLKGDEEVGKLIGLIVKINELNSNFSEFSDLRPDKEGDDDKAIRIWEKIENLISEICDMGNPIRV